MADIHLLPYELAGRRRNSSTGGDLQLLVWRGATLSQAACPQRHVTTSPIDWSQHGAQGGGGPCAVAVVDPPAGKTCGGCPRCCCSLLTALLSRQAPGQPSGNNTAANTKRLMGGHDLACVQPSPGISRPIGAARCACTLQGRSARLASGPGGQLVCFNCSSPCRSLSVLVRICATTQSKGAPYPHVGRAELPLLAVLGLLQQVRRAAICLQVQVGHMQSAKSV